LHIAIIFSRESLTTSEVALVRGVAGTRGVSGVSVIAIDGAVSLADRFAKMQGTVERAVARQRLLRTPLDELVGSSSNTVTMRIAHNTASLADSLVTADRVVNLSRIDLPIGTAPFEFQLLHDGMRPNGLGDLIAAQSPAREVFVTVSGANTTSHIVEQSRLTLTPQTPAADRRNAASRSATLLIRALSRSNDELLAHDPSMNVPAKSVVKPDATRIAEAIAMSIRIGAHAVARRVSRAIVSEDSWEIRYRTNGQLFTAVRERFTAREFRRFRAGYNRIVADPFPFAHNGVRAVFFEEFSVPALKGTIACAVLQPDGTLGPAQPVLEKPYHLSYPFVFRDRQRVYMIPETIANRTIDLYECVEFPLKWEFRTTLIADIAATDVTLHHDGTRWWMFCTVSANGEYTWDELHLFRADTLTESWQPHPANPVKRDASSSRPAGPLFRRHGALMRPTQDCSDTYGGAINLCEIEELTLTTFRERVVERINPSVFGDATGVHTLAAIDGLEVVDVRLRRRWRWERDNPDA
jgi:hypothetical protein